METAKNRIYHAMNYLEKEETHSMAYVEFKEVLSLAEKAYPKVEEFKDKVFCRQIGIFSRLMTSLFDFRSQRIVSLSTLSESKKRIIANAIFHDVNGAIEEFNSIETPLSQTLLGKIKENKQKNQDILNSLLKRCLPVIWNYLKSKA